ncbi:MAG TPA: hypothetical protein DD000_02605, partial [Cyanobacteria bacterium UBA11166]|nr:hypothetical protein [Cyanobacteria bacterium UBA11166]
DPNFTNGKSLGLTPGHYIVFTGRLVPEKCPDLLIEAFQRLQPEGWKLVLVGGSSDTREYATKLIDLADNNPNIVFTGEVPSYLVGEIVQKAGLFVLPSQIEGLPLALLEAMGGGVPTLASNIPVHLQLIANNRGLLFPVNDLEACTNSLNWAINHPQELAVMAKNAQEYIEADYNWEKITTETLGLYKQLCAKPQGARNRLIDAIAKNYHRGNMEIID